MKFLIFTAFKNGQVIGTLAVKSPFGAMTDHAPKARTAYSGADRITVNVLENGVSRLSKPEGLELRLKW